MANRWQLGDVIVWFKTGDKQDAKTDSDVYLKFYDDDGSLIGWLQAFERGDLAGFERGEVNCGFLGNIDGAAWLKDLLQEGATLGIRIENVSNDSPDWFVDRVSLDFRIGPGADTSTTRHWEIASWIKPGDDEVQFDCESLISENDPGFEDIGIEKQLEIESGSARDKPSRSA